jgi:hypothetical protein
VIVKIQQNLWKKDLTFDLNIVIIILLLERLYLGIVSVFLEKGVTPWKRYGYFIREYDTQP